MPSAVNSFSLLFPPPRLGEGSPRGCHRISAHPGSGLSEESSGPGAGRAWGRGGGAGLRHEVYLHGGNRLSPSHPPLPTPHSPRRAASAPPCRAPPQESRGRRSGRSGRSSPRQVPQGHAFPGGCKPQAKVEKGWSFPSNPFYTVKTAKLSPSRPLFNWEANRRKTKTSARADFPCVFPSQRKARSLVKREAAPRSFAPFEVWTGGAPSARGSLDWALSPPSSPNSWVSTRISSLHGSRRSHTSRASSILRFLARADVGAWVLGTPRALNYPQTQVPPTPCAGGGGLWASSPGARRPPSRPQEALADALRVSQFSLGESRSWWPHRAAPDQALNLPRDLPGMFSPRGRRRRSRRAEGGVRGRPPGSGGPSPKIVGVHLSR